MDWPPVSKIVRELRREREHLIQNKVDSVGIRLQVLETGHWQLHIGGASIESTHKYWWGASSLMADDTEEQLIDCAVALLQETMDQYAREN